MALRGFFFVGLSLELEPVLDSRFWRWATTAGVVDADVAGAGVEAATGVAVAGGTLLFLAASFSICSAVT